jgi:hypothetical protein
MSVSVRELRLYAGAIAVYLVSALLVSDFAKPWSATDWYSISVGVLLFMLGIRLTSRQSQLQTAQADLELREKVTCFYANSASLTIEGDLSKAFNVLGDALSALPLFALADGASQRSFLRGLTPALQSVVDALGTNPKIDAALRELADDLRNALAPALAKSADGAAVLAIVDRIRALSP